MANARPRWCPECKKYREASHEHPPNLFADIEDVPREAPLDTPGQARRSDPDTSKEAAKLVTANATTARVRLLMAHAASEEGMTDEEAAAKAGLSPTSEYATRCSELTRLGVIADTGQTRRGSAGAQRVVRAITPFGRQLAQQREEQGRS